MAFPRIGGAGINLNLNNAYGSAQQFSPQIVQVGGFTQSQGSDVITLSGGQTAIIPAGTYAISPGPYTSLQWFEPVSNNPGLNTGTNYTAAVNGMWRTINATTDQRFFMVDSDGGNWRLANLTGCVVGAVLTNAGTGFNTSNTIPPAAGVFNALVGAAALGNMTFTVSGTSGAQFVPVSGGALNTTITITSGGAGYQYTPIIVIGAPPPGGVQATAVVTALTAGVVSTVVVVNQGAGYTSLPPITVINDSRDSVGGGCVLTPSALAGGGGLTALYCVNHGSPVTATPTITPGFGTSGGSGTTATAVMCFAVTGWTQGTAGAGYNNNVAGSLPATVFPSAAPTPAANTVNPIIGATSLAFQNLGLPGMQPFRPALLNEVIVVTTGATQASATAGGVVDAGFGYYNTTGSLFIYSPATLAASPPTTLAVQTVTYGSVNDTSWIQPV
jgi:hypothetical protein